MRRCEGRHGSQPQIVKKRQRRLTGVVKVRDGQVANNV
jgi:hypothetical protein